MLLKNPSQARVIQFQYWYCVHSSPSEHKEVEAKIHPSFPRLGTSYQSITGSRVEMDQKIYCGSHQAPCIIFEINLNLLEAASTL